MHKGLSRHGADSVSDGLGVKIGPTSDCEIVVSTKESFEEDIIEELKKLKKIGCVVGDSWCPIVICWWTASGHT